MVGGREGREVGSLLMGGLYRFAEAEADRFDFVARHTARRPSCQSYGSLMSAPMLYIVSLIWKLNL